MPTATAPLPPPAERLDTLPPGLPDLTLGFGVAKWVEDLLIQPNGPRAGQPFRFTSRQLRFLAWWYAVDEDGRWLFNHGTRRLSKGSGKSPFASVFALGEFCGPVRLKDFDKRIAGGCIGRPVDMPLVQIAATAESQTANTMRMVRAFAGKESAIVRDYQLDPGKTRYYKLPEGTLEVITSSSTAAEGGEGSAIVADETEHWRPSNGGTELAATLQDNLTKSGSRMLETANAWVPGVGSVAEDTWDAWLAQEEGRTQAETRILYDAVIAPAETDIADRESLTTALQSVYADCAWIDVSAIVERFYSLRAKPDDNKRKYLNWPTAAADAWLALEELLPCSKPDVTVADGSEIVLFFDGSKSRDATALVGCDVESGHVFTLGVWEPGQDETVDAADVDREVAQAFDRFKVVAFFADVREWESFALTEWPRRYGETLTLHSAPNAKPSQSIAWDMRSHAMEFAKAAEACHADILSGPDEFTYDGDPRLTRHLTNARRRPYRQWVSIGKESRDSPKKIDAAVCVIGVRMVRRLVLSSGKCRRRKRTGKAAFV